MRRLTWCLLAMTAIVLASCGGKEGPLDVTLQFELHAPPDGPAYVSGTTTLPAAAILAVSLDEQRPGGATHSVDCTVERDGTFRSRPLQDGPASPGEYVVSVVMPVALRQPEEVQRRIGAEGEHLTGPAVVEGPFGKIVRVEQPVRIGGPDAADAQRRRAAEDVIKLESLLDEIEGMQAEIERVAAGFDPKVPPAQNPVWQEFAKGLVSRVQDLDQRLAAVETSTRSSAVRGAFESALRTYRHIERADVEAFRMEIRQALPARERGRQSLAEIRAYAGLPPRAAEEFDRPRERSAAGPPGPPPVPAPPE
ncbi:MAG: hypothetical protein WD069_07930 [Planctomycetales bacterium]